jgi:putative sporulation protein YtaF
MNVLGATLLAVSLSMDALGIGISYGIRGIKTPWRARLIICLISMLFTGAAVGLGSVLLMLISPQAARLLGAGMLVALGLFIIFQSFMEKNKDEPKQPKKGDKIASIALKSLGVTITIMRNPAECDFDESKHIDAFEAVYLGVALSIDSFGAGISSAVSGLSSMLVPLAAGLCQILFLCAGDLFGRKLRMFRRVNSQVFVVISGVLLIVLAVIRYFC